MNHSSLARADRRLYIALASAFLWHGGLLLSGSYRRTYDAYIHMFFGDHYARDWFSTWEPRWYTGFTVTSYPPGTHQLIGVLSKFLGLELAFVAVQLLGVMLLVLGVYRFSLIWVSKQAAGWAALLAVVSTSIAEVVHVFGQLPTSVSLGLLLNTLPSIYCWVADGSRRHFAVAVAGLAATTAAHHVTTLFGAVFFVGPVIATALLDRFSTPHPDEPAGNSERLSAKTFVAVAARRIRRVLPAVIRAGVIGVTAISVLVIVVLPYWLWSSSDPIVQVPIPHASRDSFIENVPAGLVFFVVPWGTTIVALPFVLLRGLLTRAVPLAASALLLFVLGTGGTTPIPRLLLRGAFDILTLDRFTIWSTVAVLPLMGWLVRSITAGAGARIGRAWVGPRLWQGVLAGCAAVVLVAAVLAANFAQFRPLQPDRIDPEPIAAFMEKDQHDRWRYLTLGFGDQMAIVSAATTAATVDGNYHSVRRLPELTSRSVERLEGAKFRGIPGIGSLQQFLATPETYNLKFVFSNDTFYDPLLWGSGWHRLERLANGIVVWEREDIPPLPFELPDRELPVWQRAMWGTLPMTAFAAAATAFTWNFAGQPLSPALQRIIALVTRLLGHVPGVGLIRGLARRVDEALAQKAAQAPGDAARQRLTDRLRLATDSWIAQVSSPTPRAQRLARTAMALLVLSCVGAAVLWTQRATAPPEPIEVVEAFYDDLDFRRVSDAWERLDPQTRPTFDQFELERSVQDGLVASYGKLDALDAHIVEQTADRVLVATSLSYITSLSEHHVDRTHELVRRHGNWFLTPDPSDVATTPDQFTRATEVTYLSQGRRQVTTARTDNADVLDRPRIRVLSAQVVEADGRWSVVGEIANLDVDPADMTITARFIGADDEVLVEHNASLVALHKVLPREAVPYRIDLEAIAGATDATAREAGDFYPDLFAAPQLDITEVARVELIAKAVVTGRDLERSIVPQHVNIESTEDGAVLVGQLRNNGVGSATVPHIVASIHDENGEVVWVTDRWLDDGVRPQRVADFDVDLALPPGLARVEVPVDIYGNGVTRSEEGAVGAGPLLPIDAADPSSGSVRLHVHAFYRSRS